MNHGASPRPARPLRPVAATRPDGQSAALGFTPLHRNSWIFHANGRLCGPRRRIQVLEPHQLGDFPITEEEIRDKSKKMRHRIESVRYRPDVLNHGAMHR